MNCHQKKWYVSSEFLKKKLFQRHHDDLYVNHFNQIKILIFLKKQYSWSEIHQKIKKYCDSCITCHKIKFVKYKSHGLMKFLLQFQDFWTDVIMDFIIDLSSSDKSKAVFNFILIVINKYIKMIKYVSAKKNWIAKKLINVFHTRIFIKHDMSDVIITNKKNLFISHFWNVFCYHLIVKLRYNTAFYSQIDE